jgi:hypothetical protein
MRRVAVTLALAACAAVPATADAARYLNTSPSHGARVVSSGRTIEAFELYCSGPGYTDIAFNNDFAFSLSNVVSLGRKGRFSYSRHAFRYGNGHQPRGEVRVKLSGRLTSKAVRVKWSLPGCGSGSVTAPRQR